MLVGSDILVLMLATIFTIQAKFYLASLLTFVR